MRKFVTILFVLLQFVTLAQTTEEMAMIFEINKIRKDPKSYIPTVEAFIKEQEKSIEFFNKSKSKGTVTITTTKGDGNNLVKVSEKKIDPTTYYLDKISVARELIRELNTTKPLDTLIFNPVMYPITKTHGEYLTSENKIGHEGKNNDRPYIRFKNVGNVSENVASSCKDPLLLLMLDYGVPNRGHRRNILDPNVKYISIFINNHCVVQNFM